MAVTPHGGLFGGVFIFMAAVYVCECGEWEPWPRSCRGVRVNAGPAAVQLRCFLTQPPAQSFKRGLKMDSRNWLTQSVPQAPAAQDAELWDKVRGVGQWGFLYVYSFQT